ncbi:DUF397 domain-containing protein [Streptomyces radicis]|uniref:DUF397 domain-containing protein n=1 Tax=Streptomyces radicis TaxID=1750517 RepID=A0A3A9VZX4_9ACTN|nr:DUF397 domain-containing protein [Streptomyces radicis]RKN06250.1 DUF397 domain-containing protein [Streptomyces radicis]RKN18580.1 DUF397 domain-containing protein [Streptomyces radicis]
MSTVELPHDTTQWFKSSYSNGNIDCVEVADLGGAVGTRDSKRQNSPVLANSREGWRAFVAAVADGEFGA